MRRSSLSLLSVALIVCVAAGSVFGASSFRRIGGAEIAAMLDDITIEDFEDGWTIEFLPDGTWSAQKHYFGFGESWGEWRARDDLLCMETRQVDRFNPPTDQCHAVWVDERTAVIALGAERDPSRLRVIARDAWGILAPVTRLHRKMLAAAKKPATPPEPAAKPAPPKAKEKPPPQVPDLAAQRAALERRKLALEKQRLAIEEEKIRQLAALQKQQLQLQQQALREQAQQAPQSQQSGAVDKLAPVILTADKMKTNRNAVTLSGKVLDNSRISEIEINGTSVLFQGDENRFSVKRAVRIGETAIRITAIDEWGNRAEKIVAVKRVPRIPNIDFGAYHALVIGNNDYKDLPKLKTAVNDARAVAGLLENEYGFSVTLLVDATRDDILDAFDDLRNVIGKTDNLLVYYAGHGWLDEEASRGYWLATDARADRRSRWLSNATITDALRGMPAKHVMVVADSCFSGTLTRNAPIRQRGPEYLERMAAKRTRVVLSSGGLEPVEDSGGGDHSVFSARFLDALRNNQAVIDGTQLFETVRHHVVLNARQTPQYSDIRFAGHEGGDFLFVRRQ